MSENVVTRMFDWWNQAYRDSAFSPEGFAQFFTDDAPFVVDGGVRGTGPVEIDAHFQRIRANTEAVELTTPVKATLADETTAFVRYAATFRSADKEGAEECMALARLRDGRIASFEVIGRLA
ncbi:nuclear transport factor 2 family protein [Sphingomonas oryzagri]|uniref:Nuclear transport factor 2 family protein n=1 Tax=Sphingomonas oryzagri TaxID=3042314 RepID=A0ABT6N403_9SPHN|nr:nuclear transport factor 2 family protein [Sphingomonas oryzagri]MDH7640030.1 nuclear transport factor 2 family protein [Sphingomonas oryzagri]